VKSLTACDEAKQEECATPKEDDVEKTLQKTFKAFHTTHLNVLEAIQALTELHIILSRKEMLQYWKSQGCSNSGREITLTDFVKAYDYFIQRQRHQHFPSSSHGGGTSERITKDGITNVFLILLMRTFFNLSSG
jgi:hypothetical protein